MIKPPISRMRGKSKLRNKIINYSISKEKSGRGKYKELIITNY